MVHVNVKKTGDNIRRLMDERGILAKDVQRVLCLESAQAIYKWLNGKTLPTIDNLCGLAKILQVDINDIIVVEEY